MQSCRMAKREHQEEAVDAVDHFIELAQSARKRLCTEGPTPGVSAVYGDLLERWSEVCQTVLIRILIRILILILLIIMLILILILMLTY